MHVCGGNCVRVVCCVCLCVRACVLACVRACVSLCTYVRTDAICVIASVVSLGVRRTVDECAAQALRDLNGHSDSELNQLHLCRWANEHVNKNNNGKSRTTMERQRE